MGMPEASAIAGWESITVELSAGEAGLRHVMVTVDASGTPLSAGDTVLYNIAPRQPGNARYVTESIGGRLESDGSFHGTRWHTDSEAQPDDDSPPVEATPSTPDADEVAALLALVADLLRRQSDGAAISRGPGD